MKTQTKGSLINTYRSKLIDVIDSYIIKHCLLSILMVYNTVILFTSAAVYKFIPILLCYEKNVRESSRKVGFSYDMQFIIGTIVVVIISTVLITILFRDINVYKLLPLEEEASAKIKRIRKKCMNLPYIIYFLQITVPTFIAFLTALIGFLMLGYPSILIIKITGVVFAFCFLSAIVAFTFSRHIFSRILYDTYHGQEVEGFRINIKAKILIQVVPMIISVIILTSLLGFSKIIEEKGSLLQETYSLKLNIALKESGTIKSSSELLEVLKNVRLQGVSSSCFIVEANGKIETSDKTVYPEYLINFIKAPVEGYKLYGYTEETQGIVQAVDINGQKILAGVVFKVETPGTVNAYLTALFLMLALNIFVVYFFSKSISSEITQVADRLMRIGSAGRIVERKKIPVVTNDEIGDLVSAFNKIQHLEAEQEEMKNQFFANISHELRTPLNIILSSIQLLLVQEKSRADDGFNNNITRISEMIKQNSYRLLRLINNLIDSNKISAAFYDLHMRNLNIVSVVEEISMSVANYVKEKNIDFIFDTDIEERIMACDEDMIERIMLNLFSNAVKFTEPGGSIFVSIHDEGNSIVISVKDSGIGMTEEEQRVIFDRFKQVDKSLARKREGSGIGLWLVKLLVEMHEGSIHVKSELNKGSEFIITLPVVSMDEEEDLDYLNKQIYSEKVENSIEKVKVEFSDIYF